MRAPSILLSFAFAAFFTASASEPEVTLGETRLTGVRDEALNVEFFGGIPFAESPLGALRFRPPVLKTELNYSEFDASKSGLACLQTDLPPNTVTEDCLTLNVFRPSIANGYGGEKLPVLFWIHGGAWIVGSGGRYNGSRLVSQSIARGTPVLYVAANYRLGPLGFPLGEEAASDGVLNLALQDHLAALQWVTIFGESAGARSIDLLLFHEQINDLASGAIMESDGGLSLLSPRLTNEPWSNFVSAVAPCSHLSNTSNTLDCLRSDQVSSEDVLQALINAGISFSGLTPWAPLLDGTDGLIPRYPSQSSIKAKFPVIIGSCLDEGTILQPQTPPNTSSDDAIRNLITSASSRPPGREKEIQQIIDRTLREYPNIPSLGSPFGTGNDTFGLDKGYKRGSAVGGDLILQSHRRFMSHRLAQRHDGNSTQAQVFSYLFAESNGGVLTVPPEFIIGSPVPGSLGVPHASEIFYVFGTLEDELGPGKVTTNALELSQTVMDYWISFAVSGNPNDGRGEARPHWAPYNPDDPMSIQLKGQDTRMISDTFRKQGMAVFNEDPTALRR